MLGVRAASQNVCVPDAVLALAVYVSSCASAVAWARTREQALKEAKQKYKLHHDEMLAAGTNRPRMLVS